MPAKKNIALMLVAITLFAPLAHAAEERRSVLVAPVIDGDADVQSEAIAANISYGLAATTMLGVLDLAKVGGVVRYARPESSGKDDEAARLVQAAREDYYSFNYERAAARLKEAIALLEREGGLTLSGQRIVDAKLALAMVARSRRDTGGCDAILLEIAKLHPSLVLPEKDYPPSIRSSFKKARELALANGQGRIFVVSSPPAADIYLNGVRQGVAPLQLENLPFGQHDISARAQNYAPKSMQVAVDAAHENEKIKFKLKWNSNGENSASRLESNQIVHAALTAADAAKADLAIMVDADKKGEGVTVHARMADRRLRAGYSPLIIERSVGDEELIALTAQAVEVFAEQSSQDLMSDPGKVNGPIGEGSPVLLGKKRLRLASSPFFWGGIGLVAAGAITGGIIAAASSSGDVQGEGVVRVRFK